MRGTCSLLTILLFRQSLKQFVLLVSEKDTGEIQAYNPVIFTPGMFFYFTGHLDLFYSFQIISQGFL